MVADINPSVGYYNFGDHLTHMNGTLFFREDDGISGKELWKSDGTPEGTVMVLDINPGGDSYAKYMTDMNGTLFFNADDGALGKELWKSDGTPEGTVMVRDIDPAPGSGSDPKHLTPVDGTLYFTADDGITGRELWKSDGTFEGTVLVKDITSREDWFWVPDDLTASDGKLLFTAHDGITGRELWKSDGTLDGTALVKDIHLGVGTAIDVEITYAPTEPGDHEAFLRIESDCIPPWDDQFLPITGTGIGSHEATIYSCLGDDPWWFLPDYDVFKFEGAEGEEITLTLEESDGDNTGEHATLILKDKIKGVCLFKKDKSALPNEISVTLPAAGKYHVIVAEQCCYLPGDPFKGSYCLTLQSSAGAHATLESTCWVE
jgi:ELWxxDGT repeat protein